jgi:hypothetical protein
MSAKSLSPSITAVSALPRLLAQDA